MNKILVFFAFLIGLFSATNVMYCFTIGSTNIMISTLLAVICDIYCFVYIYDNQILNIFVYAPSSLKMFYFAIVFSIVPTLFFSTNYIMRWINGVISAGLLLCVIIAIFLLMDYLDYLFWGIEVGIIFNAICVVIEWVKYNQGTIYRLSLIYKLFPNSKIKEASIYNSFRAQGLFLEPGHLARFLAVFLLLIFGWFYKKNEKNAYFVLLLGTVVLFLTKSATAVFFVLGIALLIVLLSKYDMRKIVIGFLLTCLVVAIIIVFFRENEKIANLISTVTSSFDDLSTAVSGGDSSSSIRQEGMMKAVMLIIKYPFLGVGWNQFTTHMIEEGFYSETVKGGYSAALQMIAMIGVGSLAFFWLLLSTFIFGIRSSILPIKCLGISVMIYFIVFFTTDFGFSDSVALLIGIIICMNYKWEFISGEMKEVGS